LAIGAAKSLRKNLLQEVVITLICANKLYSDPIFDTSIHIPFPRWCGYMASRNLYKKNQYNLYIDDDIRLINKTIIDYHNYYPDYYYLPSNGQMVHIWTQINNPEYLWYQKLKIVRTYTMNHIPNYLLSDTELCSLLINNQCEIIDDIWLHIDKGSEKITPARQNVISYIDI
jgi:hypothetical protein